MASAAQPPDTETISSRFDNIETWESSTILTAIWESQIAALAAIRDALPSIEMAASACVTGLQAGGRLVYVGAGTSGRIGVQDGAELPPTFGWPEARLVLLIAGGPSALTQAVENAEDDSKAAHFAVAQHGIGPNDVVIGLAASGSTPFTLAALQSARSLGACTIGLSNAAGGALLTAAAFPILVETGPEVIAGSTRMKAGTAQKVVLNMLSTLVMIRLGHVFQGLMVDMQARNEKLRHRATRMLGHLTGADAAAIAAALAATDGRVKPAVLVLNGLSAAQADAALRQHAGHLGPALAELRR
jgi:N-acetylmuramic acid 6-phosphate etherase